MKPSPPSRLTLFARTMPALRHWPKWPADFRIQDSECVAWLVAQPEVLQGLFDLLAGRDAIIFDAKNGLWRGAGRPPIDDLPAAGTKQQTPACGASQAELTKESLSRTPGGGSAKEGTVLFE